MDCLYTSVNRRNLALDNAKLILVFLVVLGHLVEPVLSYFQSPLYINILYGWIYLFHMPAFVIVSGYLAGKSTSRDFVRSILVPLFSFTVLYELLNYILFGSLSNYLFMLMPYWLLWYLFSLYIWRSVVMRYPEPMLLLRVSLCVSLLFGFLGVFGSFFGLARTVYFFPFFVFGYALAIGRFSRFSLCSSSRWFYVFTFLSIVVFAFSYYALSSLLSVVCKPGVAYYDFSFARLVSLLYGTKGYWHLGVGVFDALLIKVMVYLFSFLLAYSFLKAVVAKSYFFSAWGKNTLYVFLWHGLVVKFLSSIGLFHGLLGINSGLALVFAFVFSVFLTWQLSKDRVAHFTEECIFTPVYVLVCSLRRSISSA